MFKIFKSLRKEYYRQQILEQERYLIDKNNEYVLFSGTALGNDGDLRHLNDLYFIIFLLSFYEIPKDNIILVVDLDILKEMEKNSIFNGISKLITDKVGQLIDAQAFETTYKRDKNKDLIFIASGHGNINGLHIGKTNTFVNADFFEDIAIPTKGTLLVMTQCFAGSFHHLDTRKNICVLGASEYQESLSIPINKLISNINIEENLSNFLLNAIAFKSDIAINPFLFSFFLTLIHPDTIQSKKKHLINVYKNTASLTLNYMKDTHQIFKIESIIIPDDAIEDKREEIIFQGKTITQQSYLLNKIMAARFIISANT